MRDFSVGCETVARFVIHLSNGLKSHTEIPAMENLCGNDLGIESGTKGLKKNGCFLIRNYHFHFIVVY